MDPVRVTYKGTTYKSIRKAQKALKFNRSDVSHLIKRGYKPDDAIAEALKMKRQRGSGGRRAKPITVNEIKFNSISAAARVFKVSPGCLRNCIREQGSDNIRYGKDPENRFKKKYYNERK